MEITKDIIYVGVNDHNIDLFEGQYDVPNGMAYNSYVILDEKIAVMDSVDINFGEEWINNIKKVLGDKKPTYLVVQHMEPDHSANIVLFMNEYKEAIIVSSAKSFQMMKNFFNEEYEDRRLLIKEGDTLSLGKHNLSFIAAPMVHWPEVIMTYDSYDKVLFSADAFGKFGALDIEEEWACEARRYYFGIVGKYGLQVQSVLKKASNLDIAIICSLHGPVLKDNINYYLSLYNKWSSYTPEEEGIVIMYASIYGNTKKAVELLYERLKQSTSKKIVINDLARSDIHECIEDAFRYDTLIIASPTYNNDVFPVVRTFIHGLVERGYQNRTIGFIENGSWNPNATKVMKELTLGLKNITYLNEGVRILSRLNNNNIIEIDNLIEELTK